MSAVLNQPLVAAVAVKIDFHLDGQPVSALAGETILQVAKRNGVKIPHLCYKDGLEPVGNCRSCMVEVDGERVLAASCCRAPSAGMQVRSNSVRAVASQKLVLELLMSDMPREPAAGVAVDDAPVQPRDFGELSGWAKAMGVAEPRFAARVQPAQDLSHPAIAVNLDACIQCTRCLRACRDEQVNDVIGLAFRGAQAQIVFDQGDPMGQSTCVACGECVQACPTGALTSVIPSSQPCRGRCRGGGAEHGGRQGCRFAVPVLRCRLPGQLPRQGRHHHPCRGPQRAGQRRPPVCQGPLRFRLCAPSAAADDAVDPSRRCAEDGRRGSRRRQLARDLPRGQLGRGAGLCCQRAGRHP